MNDDLDPAFPIQFGDTTYMGMSRRDYFAAAVLPALIPLHLGTEVTAKVAYQYADCMLKANKK